MFKGAYTDEFYRLIRDALHLEVNAWSQADASAKFQAQQLWKVIENLEPSSRNSDATLLPALGRSSDVFIPLHQLSMGVGD
jgi:hypothetical protein